MSVHKTVFSAETFTAKRHRDTWQQCGAGTHSSAVVGSGCAPLWRSSEDGTATIGCSAPVRSPSTRNTPKHTLPSALKCPSNGRRSGAQHRSRAGSLTAISSGCRGSPASAPAPTPPHSPSLHVYATATTQRPAGAAAGQPESPPLPPLPARAREHTAPTPGGRRRRCTHCTQQPHTASTRSVAKQRHEKARK